MKRLFLVLFFFLGCAIAAAQVITGFDANRFVSTESATYRSWAPGNVKAAGGIVFGQGQAAFILRHDGRERRAPIGQVALAFDHQAGLTISLASGPARGPFAVDAHAFLVCPMARHISRRAPLGYTIPPYLDHQYLQTIDMVKYEPTIGNVKYIGGYVAREFLADPYAAALIRAADFWPQDEARREVRMNPEIRNAIMGDVNRVSVPVPTIGRSARGFTYFTGDFHLNAAIMLDSSAGVAEVYGLPIVYQPVANRRGRVEIVDVKFLGYDPKAALSRDKSFGPRDFKSAYDLASLFTAIRNDDARKLNRFIKNDCGR